MNTPHDSKSNNYEISQEEYNALYQRREIEEVLLLQKAKERLPQLKELLDTVSGHSGYENGIYRFYHTSCKVYHHLQPATLKIVEELQALAPHLKLCAYFRQIVADGTGKTFELSHNQDWLRHTRPIVEAFFHARYMLEMVCKYAEELKEPPQCMPFGWAAVLELYSLR